MRSAGTPGRLCSSSVLPRTPSRSPLRSTSVTALFEAASIAWQDAEGLRPSNTPTTTQPERCFSGLPLFMLNSICFPRVGCSADGANYRMIFQRSLIREFSLIAIGVVGVLLAIMLTRLLISLLGKAAGGDVLPEAVIGLIAFGVLTYLPVLLGIAVFVAVLLALTRSYRDSEMTVWFTSGLSIAAWVKPVLQFALPVALVCALLSIAITPWAQAQSVEYQRLLASRDDVSSVTPGVFRESRSSDRVFFVDKLSESDDQVNNVFVQSTENNRMGVMVAQKGFIETAENGDRFARPARRAQARAAGRAALARGPAAGGGDHGALRHPARLRESAPGTLVEPDPGGARLRALQQPAVDLPGVDRAGQGARMARIVAGARDDGGGPAGALLGPALRRALA